MRTKQVRPEPMEFEYELNISRKMDDVIGKEYILFDFRTVKEFRNFIYRLSIYDTVDLTKKIIKFNIEGLSAPELSLSESGQAYFKYKLYDFKHTEYTLDITKNSKTHNVYNMKIGKNEIKFSKTPASKKFIVVNIQKY
ncbi:hypothetical protein BH10BAC5_BH10BAC5_00410 [soil metagenome]